MNTLSAEELKRLKEGIVAAYEGWYGNQLKYRWYHGQTQFFEIFKVPEDAPLLPLNPEGFRLQG